MSHADLGFTELRDLATALRRRELSAVDVTEQMLERIGTLDPGLGAFAFVSAEQARNDALRAEEELRRGHWRGPLHGVPIAIKDVIDSAGIPTESGMKLLVGNIPTSDATCVARLRAAGAVILGKTITSEGAFVEHSHRPAPCNPWSADQSSGISSSGSGVAVAAGLCFAALGTDTGGSIRLPSALNGVTGLKPTWGRVSRHGVLPVAPQFDVIGPITRSAADAAVVLQAIAGADSQDPTAVTGPVPNYLHGIEGGVRGLRLGIDEGFLATICDPDIAAAIAAALPDFAALGLQLCPLTLPPVDPLTMLNQAHAALVSGHRKTFPSRADEYGSGLRQSLEAGQQLSAADISDAVNASNLLRAQLNALFDGVDLLLMPATATLVQPVQAVELSAAELALAMTRATVTMASSVTGHPTITLPTAMIRGLPVGLQLIGRHFDEALLLRAGHAWQRHTGHHRQHPSASAPWR